MSRSNKILSDAPGQSIAEDRLDRSRFSREMARALTGWKGESSLVVSLCGEWGSGKTTLKNFIIEELEKLEPKPIVGEFNPWQWSGQDRLFDAFLDRIAELLGDPEITRKNEKLVRKFKLFAAGISVGKTVADAGRAIFEPYWLMSGAVITSLLFFTGLPPVLVLALTVGASLLYAGLSQVPAIADSVTKFLEARQQANEKTPDELRKEISKGMADLDRPVIVFVDDIDRLTDVEIALLFQLVKANVDFPNLIYCLLYQKEIVAKSLSKTVSEQGDKYLRKIVQVQFDVPLPSERQLQRILTEDLQKILTQEEVRLIDDSERWPQIFPEPIWGYFKNVRDIKRFLSAFEFYFDMHLNENVLEVNPIDLIVIEALRMFDHVAYLEVRSSFYRKGAIIFNPLEPEVMSQQFKAEITLIVGNQQRDIIDRMRLEKLLNFLFPQAGGPPSDSDEAEWLRNQRICHPYHFDRYFQLNLTPGKPSARSIIQFIESSSNRENLVSILRSAIASNSIGEYLEFIMAERARIPSNSLEAFATALFDIGDDFPASGPLLANDLSRGCIAIIYQRLKGEDHVDRTQILWRAFQATKGTALPVRFLTQEDTKARQREPNGIYLIDENQLPNFIAAGVQKISHLARTGKLLDFPYAAGMLHRWAEWTDGNNVRAWIAEQIQDPLQARKLLAVLTTKSYVGTKARPLLHSEPIELFLPLERLYESVIAHNSVPPTVEENTLIRMLQMAVELKQAGRPYAEISEDDLDRRRHQTN